MGSSACQAALASVHSDGAAYRELLLRLGEAPEPIILELSRNTSAIFLEHHAKLVEAVLRLRWRERAELADATLEFVQQLVSAQPTFVQPCMDALVFSFLAPETSEGSAAPAPWLAPRVHATVQGLLHSCPLGITCLFASLKNHFPHRRRDALCHTAYLEAALEVARYAPPLLAQIVQLIVERFVEIDVEITLQQKQIEDGADDEMFEVDMAETREELERMRQNADKLDAMMVIAFEFTRKVCGGGGAKAEKAAAAAAAAVAEAPNQHEDALFDALQGAFLTSLLHTYKSRCTQFLHFFACACRPAFAEAFAELLFSRLRADALHAEARISCAAYLASFLARAKFEHHGGHTEALCLRVVCELISWADEYQQTAVARLGGRVAPTLDVRVHGPFYAVVQGVLYVLCYKHRELASLGDADRSRLQRVLEGALNPLRFTQENVVGEFEKLRLCDVSAVVAANERAPLSTHALGVGGEDNRLDDFFPFDPLLLKRAAAMVAPLYQLWRPIAGEERGSNMSELLSESQESGSAPLSASFNNMSCSGTPQSYGGFDADAEVRRRLAERGQRLG